MNEYQTLIRKSDGKYVGINECSRIIDETNHILFSNAMDMNMFQSYYPGIDWSLYELTTVVVIRKDDIPSDEEIYNVIRKFYPANTIKGMLIGYGAQGFKRGANWFKSKILKP